MEEGKHKYGSKQTINYSLLSNVYVLNKTIEPKNHDEASSDPNRVKVVNDEIEALYRNPTWDIAELPKNLKPVGFKWVTKSNTNPMEM